MRILSAVVFVAILGLATACSGGGSSAPLATAPNTNPSTNPTDGGSTEVPTEPPILIPALPGLVGYDLPERPAVAAIALANETDDFPWSERTEARIHAGLSDLIIAPDTLIAIECRTTTCGVVVDGPDTRDTNLHFEIANRLQELFVLTAVAIVGVRHSEGAWIAVYIQIVRMV